MATSSVRQMDLIPGDCPCLCFGLDCDELQAGEIVSFLDQHRGVTAFEWRPPAATHPSKWICDGYTESSIEARLRDLSAEFGEVFDL